MIIMKNVPMPERKVKQPLNKYPFSEMEVGDSFDAPIKAAALANNARKFGKLTGRKFVVRELYDQDDNVIGSRVWRKE
jgi:hypothetical protein